MFRLFRFIRQQLFTGNPAESAVKSAGFRRYLVFAIGEILLVVLGILIALQVDNWNDERLESRAASIFYKNTLQQLQDDRNNIQGQIAYNKRNREQFEYAVAVINQDDRSENDSLTAIAAKLIDYSDFDRKGNIYETIVNSGDVRLIQNEKIKNGLRRLEETYLYVNRIELIHYDAIMQMIEDVTNTINISRKELIDEDRIHGDRFQNLFVLSLMIMKEKEGVYLRATDELDSLMALIEKEIQQQS